MALAYGRTGSRTVVDNGGRATATFRDEAIGNYKEALAIARELRDRQGEASHLGALGLAWVEEGMAKLAEGEIKDNATPYFRTAIGYYEQALEVARAINDRAAEGSHLGNLGNAWFLLSDAARAKDFLSQALTVLREIGERPNEGFHLANLGRAHHALGDIHAAQQYGREALAIYNAYGDPRAATLRNWLQKIEDDSQHTTKVPKKKKNANKETLPHQRDAEKHGKVNQPTLSTHRFHTSIGQGSLQTKQPYLEHLFSGNPTAVGAQQAH